MSIVIPLLERLQIERSDIQSLQRLAVNIDRAACYLSEWVDYLNRPALRLHRNSSILTVKNLSNASCDMQKLSPNGCSYTNN
jgi:hypothetical protein